MDSQLLSTKLGTCEIFCNPDIRQCILCTQFDRDCDKPLGYVASFQDDYNKSCIELCVYCLNQLRIRLNNFNHRLGFN